MNNKDTSLVRYLTFNKLAGNKPQAKNMILAGRIYIGDGDSPCVDKSYDLKSLTEWKHRQFGPYILITYIGFPADYIEYFRENIQVAIDIDTEEDYYNSVKIVATTIVTLDGIIINETRETGLSPSQICTNCGE